MQRLSVLLVVPQGRKASDEGSRLSHGSGHKYEAKESGGRVMEKHSEEWRKCVLSDGFYEVSDRGRVRISATGAIKCQRKSQFGYMVILRAKSKRRVRMLVHRMVAMAFIGIPDGKEVDHIDRNRANAVLSNLRVVNRSGNMANRQTLESGKWYSKYKGVVQSGPASTAYGRPYRPRLRVNGKARYYGCFSSEVVAAMVRDMAAVSVWGECAWLNFPQWFGLEARSRPAFGRVETRKSEVGTWARN